MSNNKQLNAAAINNIHSHFGLNGHHMSGLGPPSSTPKDDYNDQYRETAMHEQPMRQTRAGARVPVSAATHSIYRQYFSGMNNHSSDDSVAVNPYVRLSSNMDDEQLNIADSYQPMNEFTFESTTSSFDPHGQDINQQGTYDPGKVDGYTDHLRQK